MAKKKIQFKKSEPLGTNVTELGSLNIDFSKSFKEGRNVSLAEFDSRPRLIRDISIAMSGYLLGNRDITSMTTIESYIRSIRAFWEFLDESVSSTNDKKICGKDITTDFVNEFYSWSINKPDMKPKTGFKIYSRVRRLFEYLHEEHAEKMPEEFNPKLKINSLLHPSESDGNTKTYTDDEISDVERVCRKEINEILNRLAKGKGLLKNGKDPRGQAKGIKKRDSLGRIVSNEDDSSGWANIGNVLWYIENVLDGKYLTHKEAQDNGHFMFNNVLGGTRPEFQYRRSSGYGLLYASNWDLLPFVILLAIKTGLNLESIITLRRDCKELCRTVNSRCNVTYKKSRSNSKYKTKSFSDEGRFSPGQLISEILRLTESSVSMASKNDKSVLFLVLTVQSKGTPVKPYEMSYLSYMLNGHKKAWVRKHGLADDNGELLRISFRSTRKTKINNRYKEAGNLANASADAKHTSSRTTVDHYIDLDATKDFHEQTIANVISGIVDDCKGVVLESAIESADVSDVAKKLNTTKDSAKHIIKGEQDMFIATCKDFYNSPNGKPNSPCQLPWGCFTCSNAIWTSRILPKLVLFYDFILEQKELLSTEDWEAKFMTPYVIMKYKIFTKFSDETMGWARRASVDISLYIPNVIRSI